MFSTDLWNKASRVKLSTMIFNTTRRNHEQIIFGSSTDSGVRVWTGPQCPSSGRTSHRESSFRLRRGGGVMPTGTYNVSRLALSQRELVVRGSDNSAFVLPMVFDDVASDHAGLGFEHVGDTYFLSKVETLEGVYTVGTPRPLTKVAQIKDNHTMSSSGSN